MEINWDAFDEAKETLEESITIPDYFKDNISNNTNLFSQTLVPCPLHDERTASFKYFSDTNSFYCFGCERGGSIVELHHYLVKRNRDGYTKSQAVVDLSKDYGIKIPNIYDNGYVNKEKLFKHKPTKINRDKGYPIKWLLSEIELYLQEYKKIDLNYYIQMSNIIDNIYLVGNNTEEKLIDVLERLQDGV